MCYSNICNSVAEVYLPKFVCSSANTLKVWVGGHISATRLRYFLAPFNAISLRVPLPVPRRRSFLFGALYSLLWARSTLSIVFPKVTNLTVPRLPKRPIGPEPFQVYIVRVIRARTGLLFLLFYFVLQNPDKIYEIGSPDGDRTRALRCDRPVF